jgi:uncharacterized Ntn-hydrolase superfamily protein
LPDARGPGSSDLAAATAVPAVGKLLTHAAPDVGAVATQAKLNPYLGIDGLRYLSMGFSAGDVRDRLMGEDPMIQTRQFAIVDRTGGTAVFTGEKCLDWAGSLQGDGFSVQGNRLAGRDVLERAARRFTSLAGLPLADRLLEALASGDAAGGDLEGEVSATIYVIDREEYPLWDIRVDDHARPITELRRLHGIFREQLLPEILAMPTRANPAGRPEEHPV